MTEQELAAVIGRVLTGATLRDAVVNHDGDAEWDWAADHLRDYLAQELAAALSAEAAA